MAHPVVLYLPLERREALIRGSAHRRRTITTIAPELFYRLNERLIANLFQAFKHGNKEMIELLARLPGWPNVHVPAKNVPLPRI